MLFWLCKLHKRPYNSRFIADSSSCSTTELSISLTAIKALYERNGKTLFWSIKN